MLKLHLFFAKTSRKSMFKSFLFLLCIISSLYPEVQNSIIPTMESFEPKEISHKYNRVQWRKIQKANLLKEEKIRIVSYNMLFNLEHKETKLPEKFQWKNRLPRIVEYIEFAKPDIIGSQELYYSQVTDLMKFLSKDYSYYGVGREDGKTKGEIEAIFYNKHRFTLLEAKTVSITSCSDKQNVITFCKFEDLKTGKKFIMLNVHLNFNDPSVKLLEAKFIQKTIQNIKENIPIILTGDFNVFPARLDLGLPFHDGDYIVQILTSGKMYDSKDRTIVGHLGPISSTNFNSETRENFTGSGTPGVILDRIFVTSNVYVWMHGIDPAKVNGDYGSDHLPVVTDVIFK